LPWLVEPGVTTVSLADAVRRDAAALLDAHRAGTWTPTAAEQDLAENLARAHWIQ
jgi:hypothetical protein